MMKRIQPIIAVVFTIVMSRPCSGSIIRIPQDYPSIQQGIAAALDGDTVLVADGVYGGAGNVNLDPDGKAIQIVSENGPSCCVIDCSSVSGSEGFRFDNGESESTVVSGFRILHGTGIHCVDSWPLVSGCEISGSSAEAIISENTAGPSVTNCIIVDNPLDQAEGAVACFGRGSVELTNCLIARNGGTGVYCREAAPQLRNCTVADNGSYGLEAAYMSEVHLENCVFWNNAGDAWYADAESRIITIFTQGQAIDPIFTTGPLGDYYLSHTAAGQAADSPWIDTGNQPAANLCFSVPVGLICMDEYTTRSDEVSDGGIVDRGYHYPTESDPTPTPSPTPEPTGNPCTTLGVTLRMEPTTIRAGDVINCDIGICNPGPQTQAPLFVVLEIAGQYFFWPEFSEFSFRTITAFTGFQEMDVLTGLVWPDGIPAGSARWIAAMTDPGFSHLWGELDILDFEWLE